MRRFAEIGWWVLACTGLACGRVGVRSGADGGVNADAAPVSDARVGTPGAEAAREAASSPTADVAPDGPARVDACPAPVSCTPLTCAGEDPQARYCGTLSDCCGGQLECGACDAGWSCADHVCRPPQPCSSSVRCQMQGYAYCGTIGDGCGNALDCTCPDPGWQCVAGICIGPPEVCPKTPCDASGWPLACGLIGDGCGGVLDCGSHCPTGMLCDANRHQCMGEVECIPVPCSVPGTTYCGRIGDGCGETRDCPQACPLGGVCQDNMCIAGPACVRLTCEPAGGRFCGVVGDGCGGALSCGPCPNGSPCVGGLCSSWDAGRPALDPPPVPFPAPVPPPQLPRVIPEVPLAPPRTPLIYACPPPGVGGVPPACIP